MGEGDEEEHDDDGEGKESRRGMRHHTLVHTLQASSCGSVKCQWALHHTWNKPSHGDAAKNLKSLSQRKKTRAAVWGVRAQCGVKHGGAVRTAGGVAVLVPDISN